MVAEEENVLTGEVDGPPTRKAAHKRLQAFLYDSPCLVASIAFHAAVLLLLATFTATSPEPPKQELTVQVEEVEVTEELQPLRKEKNLAEEQTSGGETSSEDYESARENAGDVQVSSIDVEALHESTRMGSSEDVGGGQESEPFTFAVAEKTKGVKGAVDQFAVMTINSAERSSTLGVLLIDRSRSIIYQHLKQVIARMENYFKEMRLNLSEKAKKQTKWVVISYGQEWRVKCPPTNDLERVQAALASVKVDQSGTENLGHALEGALAKFGGTYDHMLMGVLTDEAGDDLYKNPAYMEETLRKLRSANATVCAFSYQSVFGRATKWYSYEINPEKMREADRAQVRGMEHEKVVGFSMAGPECPRPELWAWQWNDRWRIDEWGERFMGTVPAGFGMYTLNRLVTGTGGAYFDLGNKEHYDSDKMYARYKPSVTGIKSYLQQTNSVPLKRELRKAWQRIPNFYLEVVLGSQENVSKVLQTCQQGINFCPKQAKIIRNQLNKGRPPGDNWRRWQAHAQLTLAQLERMHFMLLQYRRALRRVKNRHPRLGKDMCYKMNPADPKETLWGDQQTRKRLQNIREQFDAIAKEHADTPWARVARKLKKNTRSWKGKYKEKPGPAPPKLPF